MAGKHGEKGNAYIRVGNVYQQMVYTCQLGRSGVYVFIECAVLWNTGLHT